MSFKVGDEVRTSDWGRSYYWGTGSDIPRRELIKGRVVQISDGGSTIVVEPISIRIPVPDERGTSGRLSYVAKALELIEYRIQEEL